MCTLKKHMNWPLKVSTILIQIRNRRKICGPRGFVGPFGLPCDDFWFGFAFSAGDGVKSDAFDRRFTPKVRNKTDDQIHIFEVRQWLNSCFELILTTTHLNTGNVLAKPWRTHPRSFWGTGPWVHRSWRQTAPIASRSHHAGYSERRPAENRPRKWETTSSDTTEY